MITKKNLRSNYGDLEESMNDSRNMGLLQQITVSKHRVTERAVEFAFRRLRRFTHNDPLRFH